MLGPWGANHFQPYPVQELYVDHLHALRAPGRFVMNPVYDTGLITFPSFHVALSIMATRALWWVRWMRPITAITCVLIAFSTMATGWHYASDVLRRNRARVRLREHFRTNVKDDKRIGDALI